MKKTLFPALAAALVLAACGTKTTGQAEVAAEAAAQQVVSSDIAYVQVEAVLAQCDLYKNEGVALQEKTEKAQKSWAQREQNLQAEAAQLQQKYEKGLITSRDAQAQQESIQKKVASYQSNAQKEAQTLDEENYVFTNRAQDLLHRAVQEINSGKKYKLILNASALIDADTTLNITPAVLAKVNNPVFLEKVRSKGEYIRQNLQAMKTPAIKGVRGMGLMIGIEVEAGKQGEYVNRMLEKGVLALTAGSSAVRLLPPLTITIEEIDEALKVMKDVFGAA